MDANYLGSYDKYMEITGATEEEAFGRMRKISMNTRKPLAEVAEAIILGYEASH